MPIKPEVMIKSLNRKIISLLKHVNILKKTDLDDTIKNFLRKSIIAEVLNDRYVIAISGLQGVGKSTLIKQIYEIPDEYIPENLGRGERLPILVTEYDVECISSYVKRITKNDAEIYSVSDLQIKPSEFYSIAKDPSYNDLFLELRVPYKHFNNSYRTFALLPGLEGGNEYWEQLIKHTLTCAATCLFVLNERKISDKENEDALKKIQKDFEKAKPLIALSFSDESTDNNKGLKKRVLERFGISHNEEDRVICAGATDELKFIWIPELISALDKYSATQREFRLNQADNLNALIKIELMQILTKIEEYLVDIKLKEYDGESNLESQIQVFNSEKEKIRNYYSKTLKTELETYSIKPIKAVEKEIIDEKVLKKIKRLLLGKNLKELIEFTDNVIKLWNESNDYSITDLHVDVLNDIYTKKMRVYSTKMSSKRDKAEPRLLLGDYSQKEISPYYVDDDVLHNLRYVFDEKESPSNKMQYVGDLEKTIKIIPILSLEYLRIASVFPQFFNENNQETPIIPKDEIEEIVNDYDFLRSQKGKVVAGLAIILGIDAADGTIHTIPALLNALGFQAGTLAATASIIISGTLGVGILAASITRQMYKMEFEDSYAARNLIMEVKSRCHALYMDKFDDYMGHIQEVFVQRLHEKYKISENMARYENLSIAIIDVRQIGIEIGELVSEHTIYMG